MHDFSGVSLVYHSTLVGVSLFLKSHQHIFFSKWMWFDNHAYAVLEQSYQLY